MPNHRAERMAEAIREVVAQAILFEVSDPRVRGVTVTKAEVSPDLRVATVYISLMGEEKAQALALRGLRHAGGFLQAKMAARLQTKFTPTLSFQKDEGVKKSIEMSRLIDDALAADREAQALRDARAAEAAADPGREDRGEGGADSSPRDASHGPDARDEPGPREEST